MAKDRFGYQNTPQSYAISNPFSGSKFNTAEGTQVFEAPSGETNPVSDDMRGKVSNPYSKNVTDFGSADFDVTDQNEVLKLQQSLGLKEDGMFGPKTEAAYRNMVNERRSSEGKDIYNYEDPRRPEAPIPSQVVEPEYSSGTDPNIDRFGYANITNLGSSHGREYDPEDQPTMMRNKQEKSRGLWDMLKGMF